MDTFLDTNAFLTRHYESPNPLLWQGRKDEPSNERFFQRVECVNLQKTTLSPNSAKPVLIGFASDEGIRRNHGRIGARLGPEVIRKHLAKLACHSLTDLQDIGNINCLDKDLESAQEALAKLVSYAHQETQQTFVLGGGHEVSWGHYLGLSKHYPNLGIMNFDAHFDTRSLKDNSFATSGTSFWQIQQHRQMKRLSFDYYCLGIQDIANTNILFERAHEWGIHYLTAEYMHANLISEQIAQINQFIDAHTHLYLTICLDVFAEAFAPGVSAPQSLGLNPIRVLPLLKYIVQTGKVVGLDIAELSPPHDRDDQTARLVATLLAELLNCNLTSNSTNIL